MYFHTLQRVVIDRQGGYKFIVVRVTDSNGRGKMVIRAKAECEYHRDILAILRQELMPHNLDARCIGGGRIQVAPEGKTIHIWDYSGDFGKEPNRSYTVRMLKRAFPGHKVSRARPW